MKNEPSNKLPAHGSPYRLERFAFDELNAKEREETIAFLHANNQDPAAIKADLNASNAEILAQYPPQMMAARIQDQLQNRQLTSNRTHAARPRFAAAAFTATALSAAALLAVFVLSPDISTDSPSKYAQQTTAPEGIRYKGLKPSLQLWRQTKNSAERLEKGAHVSAGDRLQLRFQTAGAQHGVIASIDGNGQTTLHYPDFEGGATTLPQGASTLNHSYQLDDAPAFERFFFVTSATPIDSTALLDTIEQFAEQSDAGNAPLILSEDLSWTDFLVTK